MSPHWSNVTPMYCVAALIFLAIVNCSIAAPPPHKTSKRGPFSPEEISDENNQFYQKPLTTPVALPNQNNTQENDNQLNPPDEIFENLLTNSEEIHENDQNSRDSVQIVQDTHLPQAFEELNPRELKILCSFFQEPEKMEEKFSDESEKPCSSSSNSKSEMPKNPFKDTIPKKRKKILEPEDQPSCSYGPPQRMMTKNTPSCNPNPVKSTAVQNSVNFGNTVQCSYLPGLTDQNLGQFPYFIGNENRLVIGFRNYNTLAEVLRSGILYIFWMYNKQSDKDYNIEDVGYLAGIALYTYQIAKHVMAALIWDRHITNKGIMSMEDLIKIVDEMQFSQLFDNLLTFNLFQIPAVTVYEIRQFAGFFFSNSPDCVKKVLSLFCNGNHLYLTRGKCLFGRLLDRTTGEFYLMKYFMVIFLKYLFRMANNQE